jgi:hypothetical protein
MNEQRVRRLTLLGIGGATLGVVVGIANLFVDLIGSPIWSAIVICSGSLGALGLWRSLQTLKSTKPPRNHLL